MVVRWSEHLATQQIGYGLTFFSPFFFGPIVCMRLLIMLLLVLIDIQSVDY